MRLNLIELHMELHWHGPKLHHIDSLPDLNVNVSSIRKILYLRMRASLPLSTHEHNIQRNIYEYNKSSVISANDEVHRFQLNTFR